MLITVGVLLICLPYDPRFYFWLGTVLIASLVGYLDDRKPGGLSELALGLTDLAISRFVCVVLMNGENTQVWLPFASAQLTPPPWGGVLLYTPVVWLRINAVNCNDGVGVELPRSFPRYQQGRVATLDKAVGSLAPSSQNVEPHGDHGDSSILDCRELIGLGGRDCRFRPSGLCRMGISWPEVFCGDGGTNIEPTRGGRHRVVKLAIGRPGRSGKGQSTKSGGDKSRNRSHFESPFC